MSTAEKKEEVGERWLGGGMGVGAGWCKGGVEAFFGRGGQGSCWFSARGKEE